MPANRNALLRYTTIDKCLQNRQRKWTLEDLIDACSDALYEYEGIDKGISRRTVQMDVQLMRSEKLGYNAPIIVKERKYYTYEDPEYSISNNPLSEQDLGTLDEVVNVLRQFKGFAHFKEVGEIVSKLENKIITTADKSQAVIDFEKNDNLRGLEYLDVLYQAILKKQVVELEYQSFKSRNKNKFHFHAYLLKEYRNRWFVLGVKDNRKELLTLALDRIYGLDKVSARYIKNDILDPVNYYADIIGVTRTEMRTQKVVLAIDRRNAPYVLTKPLHASQELLEKGKEGIVVQLNLKLNFELERVILGFGDSMEVIKPAWLRKRISARIEKAGELYSN